MDFGEVVALMAVVAGFLIIAYPLVRAVADRIRPHGLEAGVKEELQLLREDLLSEMQQARREIADLGERMDFAERLLARQPRDALPKPGS
jgi:hypothetical protein